jgi:hypothetical protein
VNALTDSAPDDHHGRYGEKTTRRKSHPHVKDVSILHNIPDSQEFMDNNSKDQRVLKGFEKALNEHGYGFHYAVLKQTMDLYDATPQHSAFFFEAAEFPVESGGNNTKIDFVLQRIAPLPHSGDAEFGSRMFLLAECKRVNPALSNRCFIRAPFTRRTGCSNALVLEAGVVNSSYQPVMRKIQYPTNRTEFFHIALPIFSVISRRRDRALMLVAYRHGLRASEIGMLQRCDVDFRGKKLKIHRVKGSLSGIHSLHSDEVKALEVYLTSRTDNSSALFLSQGRNGISRKQLHDLGVEDGAKAAY